MVEFQSSFIILTSGKLALHHDITLIWKINLIIRRYLVKQVVSTSSVVVILLTVIMMGGQLIKRFGQAAMGRNVADRHLDLSCILQLNVYRDVHGNLLQKSYIWHEVHNQA